MDHDEFFELITVYAHFLAQAPMYQKKKTTHFEKKKSLQLASGAPSFDYQCMFTYMRQKAQIYHINAWKLNVSVDWEQVFSLWWKWCAGVYM